MADGQAAHGWDYLQVLQQTEQQPRKQRWVFRRLAFGAAGSVLVVGAKFTSDAKHAEFLCPWGPGPILRLP